VGGVAACRSVGNDILLHGYYWAFGTILTVFFLSLSPSVWMDWMGWEVG
jgi:hypothetical protein